MEGFSLRILVIDSYPEAVAESVCYVFPEALTGVVGQAAIPLLPREGAVHFFHAQWESCQQPRAACIQLQQIVCVLVHAYVGGRGKC